MERLLAVHLGAWHEALALPEVKPATRIELYRRLHRARDFMDSCLCESIKLQQVAAVAWLSQPHFIRAFRRLFGISPHQYLTRKRLERAKRMLRETNLPVTEVCLALGFESLGSFSTLFRRRVGVSPAAFRMRATI